MVPVVLAAPGESIAVRGLAGAIEEVRVATIASDTVPLKIRDVPRERRSAVARSMMPHDACLNDDPPTGSMKARVQRGVAPAAQMAGTAAS